MSGDDEEQGEKDGRGEAQSTKRRAEGLDGFADVAGLGIGREKGETAGDLHHAEGDDKAGDAEAYGDESIDPAADGPGDHGEGQGGGERESRIDHGEAEDGSGEGHDRSDGEVDATGEDDESHAYGEHGEGGHLVRDLLKGRGAEEMASGESEEEDDRSQHADQPERFAEAEAGWAGFVRHGLNRNGWNQGNCALVMRSRGVFLSAGAASPWRMERATSIP